VSLSKLLKTIRKVNGASLRAVEEATGISNAYLSQLERGDAQNPSPDKLHALAEFYNVPYTDLMRAAGYLQTSDPSPGMTTSSARTSTVQAALMSAGLSPEEEDAVVKYIEFLRFQNKK
jgi:HTH-type transcriptional regulator, competence development regulator